jgi:hypothetical protein
MAIVYAEGSYLVRVEDQRFMESPREKILAFVLSGRVLKNLDDPSADVKQFLRDITLYIDNDETAKQVLYRLHQLGYSGNDLSGVDPDTEGYYSFAGKEIKANCRHKPGSWGDPSERWYLADPVRPNLGDKSKLREFDRILIGSRDHGTEGGGE